VKNKIYANAPQTIRELKHNIRNIIRKIESQLSKNVMRDFLKTVDICKILGNHLSDIMHTEF